MPNYGLFTAVPAKGDVTTAAMPDLPNPVQGKYPPTVRGQRQGGLVGAVTAGNLCLSPGETDPWLWHRGSLYHCGYFGLNTAPASSPTFPKPVLPATGTRFFNVGTGYWWDAPHAWGKANHLVRKPRCVILRVGLQFDWYQQCNWIDSIWDQFLKPLNCGIWVTSGDFLINQQSRFENSFLVGVPLTSVTPVLSYYTSGNTGVQGAMVWSTGTTDPTLYKGGQLYVASITASRLHYGIEAGIHGPDNYTWPNNLSGTFYRSDGSYAGTVPIYGVDQYPTGLPSLQPTGGQLLSASAAADVLVLNQCAARFDKFLHRFYQADLNPSYQGANISDQTAANLMNGSQYLARSFFPVGDQTTWRAMLLADIQAFFV